jgi:hypothetical protein
MSLITGESGAPRSPNRAVYANSATTAIPLDFIASTLQRIQIGARQLLHFAEVACVKTKSRTKHLFLQIQMKMRRQTSEHPEAGVIVKFANNPWALIQNRIGQGCGDKMSAA